MKIKLGIIGEEHAINILQEVIEEYDDYEVSIFIDNDETRTLNIIANHQQEVDTWLVFDQINYLRIENGAKYKSLSTTSLTAVPAFTKRSVLLFTKALISMN